MKPHDYDLGGVTLVKFVHMLRAVAASGNNDWKPEKGKDRIRHRLVGEIAGIKLDLVEDLDRLSLRGDGWMVTLVCDVDRHKIDSYMIPAVAGTKFNESSKSRTYPGTVKDVEIKSENAFRHDMSILLLFENQWVS